MNAHPFEIICEIEPPVRPDLTHARHQIGVLTAVSSTFLIPDNHIGRATVSSIAVAHEVQAMGGHSIACINSRDRNLLGFRRDLLTAAAYGVSQFLFVYGDKPGTGGRTSDLTVRSMIEEARSCTATDPAFAGVAPWRIGVAAGLKPLPRWKHAADFIFSQVSYSADAQLRWRDANPADVPVYAGVMVLAIDEHTPFHMNGLRPGAILTAIDGHAVTDLPQLQRILPTAPSEQCTLQLAQSDELPTRSN